jgi:uncharacterized paraquat-inducible protein A
MTQVTAFLVVSIVALSTLVAAGPTVVALVHAIVPVMVVLAALVVALRLLWYFTNRY